MDYPKALASVKAYLPEDKEIVRIIEMCDLEPAGKGWRLWTDSLGHNLIIKNNKCITSKKVNPVSRYPFKIKDIHYKSSAKQISNISKWSMISLAESQENGVPNICFLWFLGFDNRLRLLCYMKDEWIENKPPLSSGINTLRTIIKNIDEISYKVIKGSRYVSGPYEGNIIKSWVSSWPPSNNMKLDILLTNRTIGQKILSDCGVIDA
jgi:hypothetical protein